MNLGSRKFLLTVMMIVFTTGLLLAGKLEAGDYMLICKWVFALYIAGNLGVHLLNERKDKNKPLSLAPPAE